MAKKKQGGDKKPRAPRRQLSTDQRNYFEKRMEDDKSDEHLRSLVAEWNAQVDDPRRTIDFEHLRRIRDTLEPTSKFIWETIKSEVEAVTATPSASETYEPRVDGYDDHGKMTKPVDASKVPWASQEQIDSITFDFGNPGYPCAGMEEEKTKKAAKTKVFKQKFRRQFDDKAYSRMPKPVKIPLDVGSLLFMDFWVIHAGMPYVAGEASLRGHMYWAQVAGRDGEAASRGTCFPWATYHKLYPSWRILVKNRWQFE